MRFRRPDIRKVGLALGGGAVLGAAHIGVLRALEEREVRIHALSGTSIGALVASLYAFGLPVDTIAGIAREMDWLNISRLSLSRFGLLSNEPIGAVLRQYIGKDAQVQEARIPLAIIATDVGNGERIVFRSGSLATAVMASTCIPGIFVPIEWEGRMLVDGGIVDNVPVSVLRQMDTWTRIGVDLNANRRYERPENLFDVIANAIDIAIDHSARIQAEDADLIIAPDLTGHSRTDPSQIDALIEAGYQAACQAVDEAFFIELF